MQTYFSDLIPKIGRFSKKLDDLTLLINQHWIVIDDVDFSKLVYIFRGNNELLISKNGVVEKGKWEYLGNNSILIERNSSSYLFKHGFFDENILALKIDGKEEYVFLVNENKTQEELNSYSQIHEFLENKYQKTPIQLSSANQRTIGIEATKTNSTSGKSKPEKPASVVDELIAWLVIAFIAFLLLLTFTSWFNNINN